MQTFLGITTPSGGFGMCPCLQGLRYVIFLKFKNTHYETSTKEFKILGEYRRKNLQDLITLDIWQSINGRRYNRAQNISLTCPKISIHPTTANK
jgi:hypothetical protein